MLYYTYVNCLENLLILLNKIDIHGDLERSID